MITYMKCSVILCILLVLCKTINCHIDPTLNEPKYRYDNDYVDPHSFYYNKHSQTEVKTELLQLSTSDNSQLAISPQQKCYRVFDECLNKKLKDIPDELFSRRLVNILLSLARFEESDHYITGSITIEVTSSELKRLKNFGLGKATIRDVDPIIANIFKTPDKNVYQDIYSLVQFLCMNVVIHKEIVIAATVVLYIAWVVLTTRWNMLKLIGIIVLIIFAASFIITWLQLLREAEIKLTVKQMQFSEIPIQCRPERMGWWDKLVTMFTSLDHCQKYYEAMMENSFLKVTPAQALSHMFGTFFFQPATLFGSAISDFVHHSTKHLWYPVRVILAPLLIILIILFAIVAIVCLAGGSFGWGFGPFTMFSLRGSSHSREDRHISSSKEKREPIEVILNLKVSHEGQTHQIGIDSLERAVRPAIAPTGDIVAPIEDKKSHNNKPNDADSDKPSKSEKLALSNHDPASGDSKLLNTPVAGSQCSQQHESESEQLITSCGSGDN